MSAALVAGLLAGYGIAVPVGAVGAYLVTLSARTSLRIGVRAALGVATADGLYAMVAMAGGTALTTVIEPVMLPLRWVSALVVIALGCRTAVAAVVHYRTAPGAARTDPAPLGPARAYFGFLGITMMNPITLIYFAALVLAGNDTTPGFPEKATFVVAAFAASASWQLVLAGGGALVGRVLTGRRGRLCVGLASSVVVIGLAAHLLLSRS